MHLIGFFYFITGTRRLTLRAPHADNEAVQLTAQEVAFLLQLLDALLQPGILLQSDVQVSSQVRDQDERAVLSVRRLLNHRLCIRRGEEKTEERRGEKETEEIRAGDERRVGKQKREGRNRGEEGRK